MENADLMKQRANVYKFLSTLYRDEIPEDLVTKLTDKEFVAKLKDFSKGCKYSDLGKGLDMMAKYLARGKLNHYKDLSYEYADIFLNAGENPALPYESVHATGEPVVMQKSVFDVRAAYRKAGVHKSDDYKDLDDYIAVELEFVRHLLEKGNADAAADFLNNHLMNWIPGFHAALYGAAVLDFYKGLSAFTLSFLFHDLYPENPDYQITVKGLSEIIDQLKLGDDYVTLAKGAKEEGPEKAIPTHCYTCGALCGQVGTVRDGILLKTGGLKGDPKSGGLICPKGANNRSYVYSAHRLKEPLIKENGRFRKASWEEALDLVAEKLKSFDPASVLYFRGNDWNNFYHEALFDHYGAHKVTHRPMCDNAIRMANEHNLNDKRPWLNTEESDYMVFFGQNPLATSYGWRQVGNIRKALKRGAKLVVFDPRKSESAAVATDWIQPIPGTDGAIATAMCYVIVKNELYDKDFVENWTHGFEDFKKRLLGEEDGVARTPEWAEKISGVPAETIERIAREFAAAKAKGVGSWAGTSQCPNGYETTMAVQALNGLCGTFDAPGGPSLPFKRKLKPAWGEGQTKPPANSPPKLDKVNMWAGAIPSYFPKDVAEGKIKAMINWFGDPILSWGNEVATAKACKDLEFLVTIDAWMPNVGPVSDVVLPDVVACEDSQVKADWLYEAFIAYYAQLVKPLYNVRPWWWMCKQIANRLGLGEHFPWEDINEANENMLKGTQWSFEELKEKGFIITDEAEYYKYKKWGSLNVPEGYGSSGKTKTGKYNFRNPVAEEKGAETMPDYIEPPEELKPDNDYPLIFGNFRLLEHEHSSTFNNYALMRIRPTNPLWINVKDAEERGIKKGDKVIVRSPWGHKILVAHPTEDIRKGVVGSGGGYGHIRGLEGDPKYRQFGGTNTPGLMKPNAPDPNGGNPMIKYIKVQVEAA
jgi:anaerobic selenocysteine-containing dehydrogenase/TorA maturation chaperone TorD